MSKMRVKNNDNDVEPINLNVANHGPVSYSEKWSLHPGEALRRKRGLSAKEQQALAKQPVVLAQGVFESPILRRKAFYADEYCLIFCGEVREVYTAPSWTKTTNRSIVPARNRNSDLANRTTARERVSYHVAESYTLRENPVSYGSLVLAERDVLGSSERALPPAEHHVVVAWYETPAQLAWTRRTGLANVRLGDRPGSWRIPPEIASARHLLLRTHRGVVTPGLFRLQVPGYRIFTVGDLRNSGYPGTAGGEIYAVFEVVEDPVYAGLEWDGDLLMRVIAEFEGRKKHTAPIPLGRISPYPRVLSLRELLKALKSVVQSRMDGKL